MVQKFTAHAQRAVGLAREEAKGLNHSYIGTVHLLLGLVRLGEDIPLPSLSSLGISPQALRAQVVETLGRGTHVPSGHIPFAPRTKQVIELSGREALQLGSDYTGPEHLLLGIISEDEDEAAQLLVTLGANLNRVRQQMIQHATAARPQKYVPHLAEPLSAPHTVDERLDLIVDLLRGIASRLDAIEQRLDEGKLGRAHSLVPCAGSRG